jgi:cyanophycinase-like exopeptidase
METWTYAVGSLDALRVLLREGPLEIAVNADVVIVPTAAAFTGMVEAALHTSAVFDDLDAHVEALMVSDRAATNDDYYVTRVLKADLVVLCDGSALHARSVWRANEFGNAINAASTVVAIGEVASVLGDVMIDPRGGAPTTGLGYCGGAALSVPASDEQMSRTRSLLSDVPLIVVSPSGVVRHDGEKWSVVTGDVTVTRGHDVVDF